MCLGIRQAPIVHILDADTLALEAGMVEVARCAVAGDIAAAPQIPHHGEDALAAAAGDVQLCDIDEARLGIEPEVTHQGEQ
ncbi:hypothetical protein D9M70_626910 [compost metagenome]